MHIELRATFPATPLPAAKIRSRQLKNKNDHGCRTPSMETGQNKYTWLDSAQNSQVTLM